MQNGSASQITALTLYMYKSHETNMCLVFCFIIINKNSWLILFLLCLFSRMALTMASWHVRTLNSYEPLVSWRRLVLR